MSLARPLRSVSCTFTVGSPVRVTTVLPGASPEQVETANPQRGEGVIQARLACQPGV